MDLSSSASSNFVTPDTSVHSEKGVARRSSNGSSDPLSLTDTNSSSIYDSALDNSSPQLVLYPSEIGDNSSSSATTITNHEIEMPDGLSNFESTLNSSRGLTSSPIWINSDLSYSVVDGNGIRGVDGLSGGINESQRFIQTESTESTNTVSQEEVDPKSQLANKTILKAANPNSSIIEIDNSTNNAVLLIETASDDEGKRNLEKIKPKLIKSPMTATAAFINEKNISDKRRKKAETLMQSSKQKLDVAIAEASAAAGVATATAATATVDGGSDGDKCAVVAEAPAGEPQPETKRDIKIYDTIDEFEQNLPSTVSVLESPFGSKVYLVGTAHFSEESQDDVSYVIRNVRPDVVMVELCPSRIHILKLDEKTLLEEAKNFTLAKIRGIIQAHGYINGIFFILLLQMSAQIAKDLGMAPGGEFRRAFEEIHKLPGCILHLGDRPIRITLHRALRALSLWQTIKLVWRLTSTDTISIEEVEECKQRDLLEKLMQEMAGEFPAFSDVFVKERDLFLCHSLQLAALPQAPSGNSNTPRPVRVVGVVGIGHANGIVKMWGRVDPSKIPAILEIPPASISTRICKYTLKYGFIGLTLLGAFKILRPRLARLF